MSSVLIHGGTNKARTEKAKNLLNSFQIEVSENNPDLLVVEPQEGRKSIGITQSREITNFLSEKPFSSECKAVLVDKAELLTTQAQNALLKILEEHPTFAHIILNSKTENSLLETVQSRCKKISAETQKKEKIAEKASIKPILEQEIGERLTWAEKFAKDTDRQIVIETLETWILELREGLNPASAANIELISKIKGDLEKTNVTLKLALELLVIKLKK